LARAYARHTPVFLEHRGPMTAAVDGGSAVYRMETKLRKLLRAALCFGGRQDGRGARRHLCAAHNPLK